MKKLHIIVIALVAFVLTACTVPEVTTIQQPDGTSIQVTNEVPDPKGIAGLDTAKAIVTVVPPNPYTAPALGLLTLIGGAWSLIAEIKNARNKKLLTTVIKGVEAGNNDDTKIAIATIAKTLEVNKQLDSVVQSTTRPNG